MVRWMEEILHQFIGGLSHYFQAFYHPRWCRISSIHSIITLPHPAGAEAHVLHCPRSRGRQHTAETVVSRMGPVRIDVNSLCLESC